MFKGMTRMDGGHSCLISDLVPDLVASFGMWNNLNHELKDQTKTGSLSRAHLFIKKKHRKSKAH